MSVPYHKVRFESNNLEGDVPDRTTLLDAAYQLGVSLSHVCGGIGACGTCKVKIIEGRDHVSAPVEEELARNLSHDVRLACQAEVRGDVVVDVVTVLLASDSLGT